MPRHRVADDERPARASAADPSLAAAAALALEPAAARESPVLFARRTIVNESTGETVESLPPHVVRWIEALADDSIPRLCVTAFPGAAKTTSIAAVVAWFVLRAAAGLRQTPCLYASANEDVARTFMRGVRRVCTSDFARRAFPEVDRIKWTDTEATIPGAGRLPLLAVVGVESRILSRRSAFAVFDDGQPPQLARFGGRDAIARSESFFRESLCTRMLDRHSRVVCSAAPYGPADLVSQLSRDPQWRTIAVRARDDQGRPTWPDRFGDSFLRSIEVSDPGTWQRTWMLDSSVGDSRQLFSEQAIGIAVQAGRGTIAPNGAWAEDLPALREREPAAAVLAVDPAFSEKGGDATGIVAVCFESTGRRRITDAQELHLGPHDLVRSVLLLARKHGITGADDSGTIVVESNAAQAALVALLQAAAPHLRIEGRTLTAKTKWNPDDSSSLPGLAAAFARGQYVLPCKADGEQPEYVKRMVTALRGARADADSHTPDLVAALLHAHGFIEGGIGPVFYPMPELRR